MAAKITITRVLPVYPHEVFIQWTMENPDNTPYTFKIFRSGSPTGPFEQVSEEEVRDNNFFYMDQPVPQLNLTNRAWYIVQAIPETGPDNAAASAPQTVFHQEDKWRGRIGRKARRDLDIQLRKLNGVKLVALKRKRFGTRCSVCYNPRTKDVVLSSCGKCYGTSFDGGYHDPVTIWAKLDPAVVSQRADNTGLTDSAMFSATMLDYPLMEPEDVLVEMRTNRRFIVRQKIPTESSRITVHQDLQISELSRADAAYAVELDLTE